MRHLIVAATMFLAAIVITFSTASILQVMAVAHSNKARDTAVVEATKPAVKPAAGKARLASEGHDGALRAASYVRGLD